MHGPFISFVPIAQCLFESTLTYPSLVSCPSVVLEVGELSVDVVGEDVHPEEGVKEEELDQEAQDLAGDVVLLSQGPVAYQGQVSEGDAGDEEIGEEEAPDEGHDDLAKEGSAKLGEEEVDHKGQEKEKVGYQATNGVSLGDDENLGKRKAIM